jgi:hypothetical protein
MTDLEFRMEEAKRRRDLYKKNAERMRTYRRNAYRIKHGIPLDQPVRKNTRRIP